MTPSTETQRILELVADALSYGPTEMFLPVKKLREAARAGIDPLNKFPCSLCGGATHNGFACAFYKVPHPAPPAPAETTAHAGGAGPDGWPDPLIPTPDAAQGKAITSDTPVECGCTWRGHFRELLHDRDSMPPKGCCPRCQSQFRWKPIYPEASGTAREAPSKASDTVSASSTTTGESRLPKQEWTRDQILRQAASLDYIARHAHMSESQKGSIAYAESMLRDFANTRSTPRAREGDVAEPLPEPPK